MIAPKIPIPPNALIILLIAGAIALNPTPISIAVSDCENDIGLILDIIQEDTVIPIAMNTIEAATTAACFKLRFKAATFSKAFATTNIPIERPITAKKFIPPTSLKAIPIARTATAISNIVPIPFLILLSCFLSPPAFSKSLFLSPDALLESCIIVS